MKLVSKVGQTRDKLGKVITAPQKTGAHTPMKRLDVGLIYQNGRRQLSLYFKNMRVVLQNEKLYMYSSFHNG